MKRKKILDFMTNGWGNELRSLYANTFISSFSHHTRSIINDLGGVAEEAIVKKNCNHSTIRRNCQIRNESYRLLMLVLKWTCIYTLYSQSLMNDVSNDKWVSFLWSTSSFAKKTFFFFFGWENFIPERWQLELIEKNLWFF